MSENFISFDRKLTVKDWLVIYLILLPLATFYWLRESTENKLCWLYGKVTRDLEGE